MTAHETYGDDSAIDCPWCGEPQSVQDFFTDDAAMEGFAFDCDGCGRKIELTGVDYDVTVTADRAPSVYVVCDACKSRTLVTPLVQAEAPIPQCVPCNAVARYEVSL